MMTATYSPEDNKLRLYSDCRLGADTFARVKAAGFKWAPKQELFVAPMWTPEREDLLVELCGEVGDEDTSLVERAGERSERFDGYSDKRERDAHRARAAVDQIADAIPFGQPILVGHHSEKHARRDKERIEAGMRRAVKLWETAQYWADRAAGAIRHAKYKELPAVRARRIKTLEAERRKSERSRLEYAKLLDFWARPVVDRDEAIKVANHFDRLGVTLADGTRDWSAWSALSDGRATVDEVRAQRLAALPAIVERYARWVAHADNRLAYERAMLGESGGTAADRVKPEAGGAVRCWASPGHGRGWSPVKKVNKVSVTVEDNWGNGGKNFTRTIPFDKLKAVMSRAEVDAKRAAGLVVEAESGTGFYLTDAPAPERPAYAAPEPTVFDAMKETLAAGGVQTVVAPTLFPTPADVAERVADLAGIGAGMTVLEPSAGTGNLVRAVKALAHPPVTVTAIEVAPALADGLRRSFTAGDVFVTCQDFLEVPTGGTFDRVVMNPPFDRGSDIRHVEHALAFLKPGGRLVAVVANGPRQREKLQPLATEWIDLPADTFKGQGTSVSTAIVVIDKPHAAPEALPVPAPSAARVTRKPRAKKAQKAEVATAAASVPSSEDWDAAP